MSAAPDIAERATTVRAAIAAAAERAGRSPADVRIVVVTKTFPAASVRAVAAAGFADVGENYVQEARDKRAALADLPGLAWHLVGGLQQNKVRAAVALFDRVHTIDGEPLARALDAEVARAGRRLPVLLQVNVGGDPRKRGVPPDGAAALAEAALRLPALAVDGLMTIGALDADAAGVRAQFRTLRTLRDDLARTLGVELPHLSMGMSDDFVPAVEEGATFVRLGRILLGPRSARG